MNDPHYGWVINTHYDWINMLSKMQRNNSKRFDDFKYSHTTIYHYLDRLQHEQNLVD